MRPSLDMLLLAVIAFSTLYGGALAYDGHEAEMRAIARVLACPVCEGLSVADSPAPLAKQMRETILDRLEAGENREQVIQYFVDRYGESILFDPPKRGFSLIVWWGPVLALVAGVALVATLLWRWLRRDHADEPTPLDPAELAAYRDRIEAELARRTWRGR